MKVKLLFLALLSTIAIFSQTQIGGDIEGEASAGNLGWSLSLSSDGNIVAIGIPHRNDGGLSNIGRVRVYKNVSDVWTQIGSSIIGDEQWDELGSSVSLSSDGSIVAIGSPQSFGNNVNGNGVGYVSVYQNSSGVWTQIGSNIDGEALWDSSGKSVSLSSDGNILAIGAPENDGNGDDSGHVRVYKNILGVWTQIGADIDGESAGDRFGDSVTLSSDGNILAIGAIYNDGNGIDSGHVRVYQNISDVWVQIGNDIDGEAANDEFGVSVSLSSSGNILAIGAIFNDGNGSDSGHVRVYKNNSGVWTQIGTDIDGAMNDYSGRSVSLSADGSILAIGAIENIRFGRGHTSIYQNISDVWVQIGTDIYGEAESDHSGGSLDLSSDGSILAIGEPLNAGNGQFYHGQVRVYDLSSLLSLVDNKISENFTVYPNPVNNILQVQLTPTLEYKEATIYNYFGKQVLESKTSKINVSSLSTGVYFLKVETNKGKGVKKIIKK